jgi:hypothetical protein
VLKEVKTLADITAPESGTVDIQRGEDTLRLPIVPISQKEMDRITRLYAAPAPPLQWQRGPDGKMVQVANEADPAYVEGVKELEAKQTHAVLVSGLGVEIPGEDVDEKWDALSERFSLGEMNIIISAIMRLSSLEDEMIAEAKNSLRRTPAATKTATS